MLLPYLHIPMLTPEIYCKNVYAVDLHELMIIDASSENLFHMARA